MLSHCVKNNTIAIFSTWSCYDSWSLSLFSWPSSFFWSAPDTSAAQPLQTIRRQAKLIKVSRIFIFKIVTVKSSEKCKTRIYKNVYDLESTIPEKTVSTQNTYTTEFFYVHMNSEVTDQLRWCLNNIISRVNSSHRWRGQQQSTAGADVGVMITTAERVWPGQATGSLILYQIIPVNI